MANKNQKGLGLKIIPKNQKETLLSNQPTSHTDGINLGCREDGSVYIQFFSDTPDKFIENHRTMMSRVVAEKIAEVLCNSLDFYPEKKSKETPSH